MNVAAYIAQRSRQLGLDPRAVLAIAHMEGLSGRVGDNGTSFGPFQLHIGGAMPSGIRNPQQWAESKAGIDYALSRINSVAHGLSGQQAVAAISRRFERPANPAAEIAGAMAAYGKGVGGSPALTVAHMIGGHAGAGMMGSAGGGQNPNALLSQYLLQEANAQLSGQPSSQTVAQEGQGLLQLAMARKALQASAPSMGGIQLSPGGKLRVRGADPNAPEDMAAVKLAEKYLGTPYVWGGESPKGFDCSGLLQYIFAKQGVRIPRTTYQQWSAGKAVNLNSLQPGDAVFYKGSDSMNGLPGHVAIYIGNGKIIQAPHTGADVQITPLSAMGPAMGARSFF